MNVFLCREAGGVRRDVLRLLLRSRLLRAVRSVLGAQCQRVRPVPGPGSCQYPPRPLTLVFVCLPGLFAD